MLTKIRQIKQYTDEQCTMFMRAECPNIAQTFRQIMEPIEQLERLFQHEPLSINNVKHYQSILEKINQSHHRLLKYGEDFADRARQYKTFTESFNSHILNTIRRFNQSQHGM